MKSRLLVLLAGLAAFSTFSGAAQAGIILTGAQMVSVDAAGTDDGRAMWSTGNCCAGLPITAGADYASSSAVGLPDTLTNGTVHLFFTGGPYTRTFLAVNLFFDSSSAAQITVFDSGAGTASGTGLQRQFNDYYTSLGALPNGSLSYSSGGETVTASNFSMFDEANNIAQFDLTVTGADATPTPEPATIGLILVGAGLLIRKFRKK